MQLGGDSDGSRNHGTASEFPEWGTKRVDWRDRDVTISGDTITAFVSSTR